MKTISEKKMLAAGYKKFDSQFHRQSTNYQKDFTDDLGIKYFIHCYHTVLNFNSGVHSFWTFETTLDRENRAVKIELVQRFNSDGQHSGNTILDAENYIEKFWEFNGKNYYRLGD